jgi:hypothetical protein
MATDLVTLQEAYEHLRLDYDSNGSSDDAWLTVFIAAISEAVSVWLKVDARLYVPEVDSSGEPLLDSAGDPIPAYPLVVRPVVKAAVLIELGSQYRFREGEGVDNVVPDAAGWGYVLNKTSTALLTPLRKSTVR